MNIHPLKAFSDNYIWLIEENADVIVVDPGEAEGVLNYLKENSLNLVAILLTHNHEDHTGGVEEILATYSDAPVYGPKETNHLADYVVQDGDSFNLMGQDFEVFKTAGHTEEHISYLAETKLFCGDALFSAGCGRVFTTDYQAQYDALQKFKQLDDSTRVYAAHEYTETNLRFAQTIEPSNEVINEALNEIRNLRAENYPTLPSTMGKEKEINLFLQAKTLEDFIELRQTRDYF